MTSTIIATRKPSSKSKASHESGPQVWRKLWLCVGLLVGLFGSLPAWSYSYAAAGKEPLIEGRQALLSALQAGDKSKAKQALDSMQKELAYLQGDYHVDYTALLQKAVDAGDTDQAQSLMDRAFVAEIHRRLAGATQHFDNYQVAKVLVFKANRFLQLVEPRLTQANRQQAEAAIHGCVKAIGNPGVFGVGREPADPKAYEQAMKDLFQTLPKP